MHGIRKLSQAIIINEFYIITLRLIVQLKLERIYVVIVAYIESIYVYIELLHRDSQEYKL